MAPYNQGSFYVQESKGDLTRDHYLNSPPIEPSLKGIFSLIRKIPRWSNRDSNPRLWAQRTQPTEPSSVGTVLSKINTAYFFFFFKAKITYYGMKKLQTSQKAKSLTK